MEEVYTLLHLLSIASREIEISQKLTLSHQDRELFMSMMENPPSLKGNLKTAMNKYREKSGQ